jgi:hypothetical protein
MIKFTLDLEKNELVLEMEPPYPGSGNCEVVTSVRENEPVSA